MERWKLTAVTLQPKLAGPAVGPAPVRQTDPSLSRAGDGARPLHLSAAPRVVMAELEDPAVLCRSVAV